MTPSFTQEKAGPGQTRKGSPPHPRPRHTAPLLRTGGGPLKVCGWTPALGSCVQLMRTDTRTKAEMAEGTVHGRAKDSVAWRWPGSASHQPLPSHPFQVLPLQLAHSQTSPLLPLDTGQHPHGPTGGWSAPPIPEELRQP